MTLWTLGSWKNLSCNDNTTTKIKQESFHELFGTKGCLLYCDKRKSLQSLHSKTLEGCGNFTLVELENSIANGCQSCKAFRDILEHVHLVDHHTKVAPQLYAFRISPDFTLRRESKVGERVEAKEVMLFYPRGYPVRLQAMKPSKFLPGCTASDISIERAREWVQTCDKCHECYSRETATCLPKRLIDVTEIWNGITPGVKLMEPIKLTRDKYMCLSHCWGSVPIQCCTTKKNIQNALGFIKLDNLPKNFQDAIILTRALGIQYIWIDSICIIQDNLEDWEIESRKMATIYSNAYITIASSSSSDSTGGCFSNTRPDLMLSHTNQKVGPVVIGARMCDYDGRPSELGDIQARFPLFQRAWVFQERLLSRRILYCNFGELSFECMKQKQCECANPNVPPHPQRILPHHFGRPRGNYRLLMAQTASSSKLDLEAHYEMWREIVSVYMNLNLTKLNDVLPAISGCAQIFSGLTHDQYLAGLWRRSFARDLVWNVQLQTRMSSTTSSANKQAKVAGGRIISRAVPRSRPQPLTGPSWSWASVSIGQSIEFLSPDESLQSKTLLESSKWTVECVPNGSNEFGALRPESGILRIEASLLPAFVHRFCERNTQSIKSKLGVKGRKHNIYHRYERHHPELDCQIPMAELESRDGTFDFWPDVPPVEGLLFEKVQQTCSCALARVWLLNVYSRWKEHNCRDYFMVLKDVDISKSKYERVGLTCFRGHSIKTRKEWFNEIWERNKLQKGYFSIV